MPGSAVLDREEIRSTLEKKHENEIDSAGIVSTEFDSLYIFESSRLSLEHSQILSCSQIKEPELAATVSLPSKPLTGKSAFHDKSLDVCVKTLLCVMLIGILAGIMLPCFVGAQGTARTAQIRGNMRTIQIAAESYATDAAGKYPTTLKELEPYLPGGSNKISGLSGKWPLNPVSAQSPSCVIGDKMLVKAQATGYKPGQVTYSSLKNGQGYAITGTDANGMAVPGIGGNTLVLSCQ